MFPRVFDTYSIYGGGIAQYLEVPGCYGRKAAREFSDDV